MVRLKRKGVRAPRDWQDGVAKALADPEAFRRKAKQFEKLAPQGKRRRGGFTAYAPEVLPLVDGKREFPAVWRADKRVKEAIARMSDGRCAYCQSNVSSNHPGRDNPGHVEHFQPKSRFPTLAYDWDNYFLGCAGCNGAKHDKWPREGYVRPDKGDPAKRFVFAGDGGMTARAGDPQAENTCRDLKLNRHWLKKHRGQAIQQQIVFLRTVIRLGGTKLSRAQMNTLMVSPLSMFSAAINQNVLRAWNEGFTKKKFV